MLRLYAPLTSSKEEILKSLVLKGLNHRDTIILRGAASCKQEAHIFSSDLQRHPRPITR